jgi:hypothetical protein
VLFFILAISELLSYHGKAEAAKILARIAGWEGIVCGASAIYLGFAEIHGWPIFSTPQGLPFISMKEKHPDIEMTKTKTPSKEESA